MSRHVTRFDPTPTRPRPASVSPRKPQLRPPLLAGEGWGGGISPARLCDAERYSSDDAQLRICLLSVVGAGLDRSGSERHAEHREYRERDAAQRVSGGRRGGGAAQRAELRDGVHPCGRDNHHVFNQFEHLDGFDVRRWSLRRGRIESDQRRWWGRRRPRRRLKRDGRRGDGDRIFRQRHQLGAVPAERRARSGAAVHRHRFVLRTSIIAPKNVIPRRRATARPETIFGGRCSSIPGLAFGDPGMTSQEG